jgi:hypothetical protein
MLSIMTVKGREKIPYVLGPGQREMLQFRQGESDLCLVKGKWFVNVTCDITPEGRVEPEDMIGVDLGSGGWPPPRQGFLTWGMT